MYSNETETTYLTVSDLFARGWIEPMLRYLPKPVRGRSPHHPNSPKQVNLWRLEDVEKAEKKPKVCAELARVAGRRDRRAAKRQRKEWEHGKNAFRAGLLLEAAFDPDDLLEMTEGDETAQVLVRRIHQGILCAAYDLNVQSERSVNGARTLLREVMERTDGRHRQFLAAPRDIVRCMQAMGASSRVDWLAELRGKYTAALLRTAAVLLYEYDKRGEKTEVLQIISMPDFPAHKLLDQSLYQIYLVDTIPAMIRDELSALIAIDPKDEYPETRLTERRFFIHVGGTNTGKTYQSLQRMKQAASGVYLAPLRLLALEVQETMLAAGVNCSMLTGEEEDIRPGATHISSTVEKLDVHRTFEVAVVDECQMITDPERGFAWTRAILGCNAEEMHLCTAPEALDLLIRLVESCGEPYEVIHHERMTPLTLQNETITLDEVEDGDALIAFSKRNVLLMAEELRSRGRPASVIYGALPYATRRLQMQRFLDGETRLLVSTDAIGMGLNLPIRRVVFTRDTKFDGHNSRPLKPSEVKQIAGRAGRFGVYDEGFVTSLEESKTIQEGMETENAPVTEAMLGFSDLVLRIDHDLLEVLQVWNSIPAIAPYRKMSIDRYIYMIRVIRDAGIKLNRADSLRAATIPFDEREDDLLQYFLLYCDQYVSGREISPPARDTASLDGLEIYNKMLDLYYSFCRSFEQSIDLEWVRAEKEETAERINDLLVRELAQKGKSCRICRQPMPLDSHFRICLKCAKKIRRKRQKQG